MTHLNAEFSVRYTQEVCTSLPRYDESKGVKGQMRSDRKNSSRSKRWLGCVQKLWGKRFQDFSRKLNFFFIHAARPEPKQTTKFITD